MGAVVSPRQELRPVASSGTPRRVLSALPPTAATAASSNPAQLLRSWDVVCAPATDPPQRLQEASRANFAGQYYDDWGVVYTISQTGDSITILSYPPRPETPASGTVADNVVSIWGLTGTLGDS